MRSIFFLCLALVACGGATLTTGDDGGTDSGSGKDSGSDGGAPLDASTSGCPVSPPAQGGACSPVELECEYGTNPSPSCNQLFLCNGGHWEEETSGTICPPPSDCPPSYASVPQNQSCSPTGLGCAYPEGTCFCGGSLMVQSPYWSCGAATSECPSPRPDIGTPCNEPGQSCDYGGCSGGATLQCENGVWTQVFTPCPG